MKKHKNIYAQKFYKPLIITSFFCFFYSLVFSQSSDDLTWIEKNEDENYIARHECGFVQVGDEFILFGGRESPRVLDVYDYNSNTWTNGGMAPVDFNHFQAISYEGLVWVIGAFKTNTPNPEQSADYVYMYNPASEQWIQGMEIPESRKRGSGGLALYDNKFYLIGGNVNGHSGGYVPYFDEFDPKTGTWNLLADAPRARDHFQAAIFNNKLYALGGRLTGGEHGLFKPQVPEVDVYDFINQSWSTLDSDSNISTPRAGAATAVFENEIYVIGGETTFGSQSGNNGPRDTVEAFNPSSGTWTTKDNINEARHGIQAITSGQAIYIVAGAPGGTAIKNMEYFGIDNPQGSPNINSTLAPDELVKTFIYREQDGTASIQIVLTNSLGTTGTYIDAITISGVNYTLEDNYNNRLLGANSSLIIDVILNNTTQPESNGNLEVIYNNNASINIALEGSLDENLDIDTLENTQNDLTIFPSPTRNSFSLNKAVNKLEIYNITGKHIKTFQGHFEKGALFDISNLPKSFYFVLIENNKKMTQSRKLIKL